VNQPIHWKYIDGEYDHFKQRIPSFTVTLNLANMEAWRRDEFEDGNWYLTISVTQSQPVHVLLLM
jgi:hypothetical protein